MKSEYKKRIELSHGGGGAETQALINDLFYRYFANDILLKSEDAAVLSLSGDIAFTTDSFTVSPLFFNGGDIGKLAVVGTLNDLAMMGARPGYLSVGFMIEEGLPWTTLEQIVQSMAQELKAVGAKVVCGDTKVVPKGAVDQIFINTSGIGFLDGVQRPSAHALVAGDVILVSRDIGAHGAVVLAEREALQLETDLKTDCATLWPVVEALLNANIELHAMRDATRGGLSAVLNEWAQSSNVGIEIDEASLPITAPVKGLCELLGFEAYDLANEGTFVVSLPKYQAEQALQILRQFNPNAMPIGQVVVQRPGLVVVKTAWGSQRLLEKPKGELLPRIC